MSAARALAELVALGGTVEAPPGAGLRVRAPRPLPAELRDRVRAEAPRLLRVASGAWRQDLEGWPAWRAELFVHLAARRLGDVPPESADVVAYLEALEALPEPSNEATPSLPAPFDDLEQLEEAPPGFQHRYRPPPEHRALPPFRWSTLPPTTKRPAPPASPPPAGVIESPDEPRAGAVYGPQELPEHRAARFGYRIDEFGSWLEPGEASRTPFQPWFAVGHEPSAAEEDERRARTRKTRKPCGPQIPGKPGSERKRRGGRRGFRPKAAEPRPVMLG